MNYFYKLVSGRQRGLAAAMLRGGLRTLEVPYQFAVALRNFLYDHRIFPVHQFPVPIISVGNLTLGGTGKSPMAAWLCRYFLQQNLRPGLISRGYKKTQENVNDEFLEMAFRFPAISHIQNRDRVAAVKELLQQKSVDVIILDDAFQHRRIARTFDMVILDATAPFGFDHVFPRGTLREPFGGLRRADAAVLSRSNLASEAERQKIKDRVLSIKPNIIWAETDHVPATLVSIDSSSKCLCDESLELVRGKSALAFCGIGNPPAFQKTLEQCGVHVTDLIAFPDHYHYTAADAGRLLQTAKELGTDLILCTMKDLVKLNRLDVPQLPIQAVSIEIQFTAGETEISSMIPKPA
jgi:tetraacyldisaccharide 4'-kinase